MVCPLAAHADAAPCRTDQVEIDRAIAQIRRSVDPCGESPIVSEVLAKVKGCWNRFTICTDAGADLNSFYRPEDALDYAQTRTLTWNPDLRTQLEPSCGGDPDRPVLRDPTASLLHELAHAAQDCDGLDPAEHEFEAVRIENIYRRAKGLCQRTTYGETPLPIAMVKSCEPGHCLCAQQHEPDTLQMVNGPANGVAARAADASGSVDSDETDD